MAPDDVRHSQGEPVQCSPLFPARIAGLILLGLVVPSQASQGLEYRRIPFQDNKVIIQMTGGIEKGDRKNLEAFLRGMPSTDLIVGYSLNSPGGLLTEAELVAEGIAATNAYVIVFKGHVCASACFLLFAAGKQKIVSPGALIGVHSVSLPGMGENFLTWGATTGMARDAAYYHVPPAIIGKMVTTAAGDVAWLSRDDLVSMGTKILDVEQVPPATTVSRDDERVTTIRDEYVGCLDRQILAGLINYLAAGKFGEVQEGFKALGQSGACIRFHKGQPVVVLQEDKERQMTKVRLKDDFDEFWTLTDSLQK
jgi:hypothetical protein